MYSYNRQKWCHAFLVFKALIKYPSSYSLDPSSSQTFCDYSNFYGLTFFLYKEQHLELMLVISSSFIMHICSNYLLFCSRVAQNKWLQILLIQFCSFCGLLERFSFWPYLGCVCGSLHLAQGQRLAECTGFPVCCFSTWLVCAASNNGGLQWWDFLHSSWFH